MPHHISNRNRSSLAIHIELAAYLMLAREVLGRYDFTAGRLTSSESYYGCIMVGRQADLPAQFLVISHCS